MCVCVIPGLMMMRVIGGLMMRVIDDAYDWLVDDDTCEDRP
jgi:hypothetical protein